MTKQQQIASEEGQIQEISHANNCEHLRTKRGPLYINDANQNADDVNQCRYKKRGVQHIRHLSLFIFIIENVANTCRTVLTCRDVILAALGRGVMYMVSIPVVESLSLSGRCVCVREWPVIGVRRGVTVHGAVAVGPAAAVDDVEKVLNT